MLLQPPAHRLRRAHQRGHHDRYGPEEFLLRKAIPGKYAVRAKFFGTGQQTAVGATTVVLELYLRYGTGQVENKSITLRLDGPGRMVEVGTFTFEARAK